MGHTYLGSSFDRVIYGNFMISVVRGLLKRCLPNILLYRIEFYRAKKKFQVGKRSYIHPTVQIFGMSNVVLGENSSIGEYSWLNVNHRDNDRIAISIGSNCFIGRGNFFSSGRDIQIGDYCLTTIGCKFICSTHIIDDPRMPYVTTGTTSHDSIYVGPNCFFGSGATVLGRVRVGHGSVIGADSVVMKDIPSFSIVVGNPARVIRRFSFVKMKWCDASSVTEDDLKENPDEQAYLKMLANNQMPPLASTITFGSF